MALCFQSHSDHLDLFHGSPIFKSRPHFVLFFFDHCKFIVNIVILAF